MHGVEFDTETSRIKIYNFQPGKRYILNSHCYANVFEPQLTKKKTDYCTGRIIFSPNIFKLKLISNRVSLF